MYLALPIHYSAPADSTNIDLKIFRKKCYIVVDVFNVVRPLMVVSVLNTARLFSSSLIPKQYSITTIYITFTLYKALY